MAISSISMRWDPAAFSRMPSDHISLINTMNKVSSIFGAAIASQGRDVQRKMNEEALREESEGQKNQCALAILCASKVAEAEEDFLKNLTCAITLEEIEDPVKDPTTKEGSDPTYYQFGAILEWVRRNHNSPITRAPLEESDLVIDEYLQQRLQDLRERLKSSGSSQPTLVFSASSSFSVSRASGSI
jgi:hypothetical protein